MDGLLFVPNATRSRFERSDTASGCYERCVRRVRSASMGCLQLTSEGGAAAAQQRCAQEGAQRVFSFFLRDSDCVSGAGL